MSNASVLVSIFWIIMLRYSNVEDSFFLFTIRCVEVGRFWVMVTRLSIRPSKYHKVSANIVKLFSNYFWVGLVLQSFGIKSVKNKSNVNRCLWMVNYVFDVSEKQREATNSYYVRGLSRK